ncbi:MAG: ArsR/SmtB family transcription factor [Rubrivivax sp.]
MSARASRIVRCSGAEFRALVGAGPAGLTPGVLAVTLGVPPSSLSFHLKELSHAGLITPERAGRHIVYRPQIEAMNALLGYLTEHCCQGQPCGLMGAVTVGRGCNAC